MPDEIFYFQDSEIPESLAGISGVVFAPLRDGLRQSCQVVIGYQNSFGEKTTRRILPEVLFRYADTWYIAAYCHEREDSRTFRLDRVVCAELTGLKEASHGVADEVRANGIPWRRDLPDNSAPRTEGGGLWMKLHVADGENGPEVRVESSHADAAAEVLQNQCNFDLLSDAESGRIDRMGEDLAAGADVNFMNRGGRTALIAAAFNGFLEAVQFLIQHGADPFLKGSDGTTVLIAAARSRKMALVKYLLEGWQLDVNARDRLGWSPLYCAVLENQPEMVRYLLAHGADIDLPDWENRTVLMAAANGTFTTDGESAELLRLLIECGADVNAEDRYGRTALFEAARGRRLQSLALLLDAGADLRHHDKKGKSLLLYLLHEYRRLPRRENGDEKFPAVIRLLLARGADLNSCDRDGLTPLMLAPDDMVETLLALGANPAAADRRGTTAAMYHAKSLKIIDLLAEQGADLHEKNQDGDDVLLLTVADREHLKYLMEKYHFDPNDRNHAGNSLLHRACCLGDLASVKYLVRHGANPSLRNRQGKSPVQCLEYGSDEEYEIEFYLDDYQMNLNDELLAACKAVDAERVRSALERGAQADRADCRGRTPLTVAAVQYAESEEEISHEKFRSVLHVLLDYGAEAAALDQDGCGAVTAVVRRGDPALWKEVLCCLEDAFKQPRSGVTRHMTPEDRCCFLLQDFLSQLRNVKERAVRHHADTWAATLTETMARIQRDSLDKMPPPRLTHGH